MEQKPPIYLDYQATTPVLPQVAEAMAPYFTEHFGNANSSHQWGWKAEMAVNKATKAVADLLGAKPSQVFFTSGATESIHWAVVGWARKNPTGKVLISATEHKASFGALEWAGELGLKTEILPVDSFGLLDMEALKQELDEGLPTLLSVIYGNNEIGTLNPVQQICALKQDYPKFRVHLDAAQCVGKLAINFNELGADYLSLSGHKVYGPKGVGALLIQDQGSLANMFSGGGQQKGLRAGTLDVPSIVGLGTACAWALENMESEPQRLQELRDYVIEKLTSTGMVELNGHPTQRLPNNVSFTFKNLSVDKLLVKLPKVGFSSSSACTSGQVAESHVLKAIGKAPDEGRRTVRFGLGVDTTKEHMDYVADTLIAAMNEA